MPTYEYVCGACSNEWEAEQSIKDSALTDCPKCGKAEAKRQISRGTGFILKGSGWYSDLYASSSNKAPEASSPSGAASPTPAATTAPAAGTSGSGGGSDSGGSSGDSGGSSGPAPSGGSGGSSAKSSGTAAA